MIYTWSILVRNDEGSKFVTLGLANKVGGSWLYIVRDRLGDVDITPVTLHELGHLLGAQHTEHYLMNPTYIKLQYACIDLDTIDRVAERWNLPLNKLNYCKYD
jgi:hypothetical protein